MKNIRNIGNEMTHTCSRCGHSFFTTVGVRTHAVLHCPYTFADVATDEQTDCTHWKPSLAVDLLQQGVLDQGRKLSLLSILESRQRLGRY